MTYYVGHSLSRCIRSILLGEVSLDKVIRIQAGTKVTSFMELHDLVGYYYSEGVGPCNWNEFPLEEVWGVLNELIFTGRFTQCRLHGMSKNRNGRVWEAIPEA